MCAAPRRGSDVPSKDRSLNVEIISSAEGLRSLHDDWSALFRLTPEASGFESHAWVSASWALLDQDGYELHVAVVGDPEGVCAIFPTRLSPRGRLGFIGTDLGNYGGPVFDPAQLERAVSAWGDRVRVNPRVRGIDLRGLRARSPFLELVRRRGLHGWGAPLSVSTNTCPEVELSGGFEPLLERHKSKQRSTWRRKAARLERLGEVEFLESGEDGFIEQAIPRIAELWERRWEGQRVHGSFGEHADFHLQAARELGPDGRALLSTLRLDGEIIAFAYGLRGVDFTSSYVLAHDERFDRYSPGLLLLLRVLEAGAERGDALYDFSLGDAPYKSLWVTREQEVVRAIWGSGRHVTAAWSAAWARARSIERLRALKLGGWRVALGRSQKAPVQPRDEPGLPAGDTGTGVVLELPAAPSATASLRSASYREMRELLSPRLLALALERNFRGDQLQVVEDRDGIVGVVWQAASARRAEVAGRDPSGPEVAVYYNPVAMPSSSLEHLIDCLGGVTPGLVVSGEERSAN